MGQNEKVKLDALNVLIQSLQPFNQLDTKMQVSTILTLLEAARASLSDRKISTGDIQRLVGLLSGTGTRNVYYWGEGHKDVRGGHEYVDVKMDIMDRRLRVIRMTDNGKAFISQILGRITELIKLSSK